MLLLSACNPQEGVAPAQKSVAEAPQLSIMNWGERSTPAGVPFNVQADGHSGVWFKLNQPARRRTSW